MPIPKPPTLPRWATDAVNAIIVEPSEGAKDVGFVPETPAVAGHANWLLHKLYQWMEYLDDPQSLSVVDLHAQALTVDQLATFAGGLEVQGSLTVGGVPVATTTQVPAAGSVPASWGLLALLADLTSPSASMQVYTSIGAHTWSKPSGLVAALVVCTGGGGGGGGVNSNGSSTNFAVGGGGGAGATVIGLVQAANLGATETVTVGNGGNGGTTLGNNGFAGTESSFTTTAGTLVAAGGGGGGGILSSSNGLGAPGGGGTWSGPAPRVGVAGGAALRAAYGTITVTASNSTNVSGGQGAASWWGIGGLGGIRGSSGAAAGAIGVAYGAGGGGASVLLSNNFAAGGKGALGVVVVIELKKT
jgi:hypothetical protein